MRATRCFLVLIMGGVLAFSPALAAQNKDAKDKDKDKKETPKEGEIGGKNVSQWTAEILHKDVSVRQQAVRTVVNFGLDAKRALPNLLQALRDPDFNVRAAAAAALAVLAAFEKGIETDEAPKVVTALSNLLGNTETQRAVREQAVLAIGAMGPRAKAAIPGLIGNAQDTTSWELRWAVCRALGRVGVDPASGINSTAFKSLVASLNDTCAQVRMEAIISLSMMGMSPRAAEVEAEKQALNRLLRDPDKTVEIWARVLLMFVDINHPIDKSLDVLAKYIRDDPDSNVRSAAIRGIGTLYTNKALIPRLGQRAADLLRGLVDTELPVILTTIATIGGLGENASANAAAQLASYMQDSEVQVRLQAVHSLGNLGSLAKPHIARMIEVLQKEKNEKDPTMTLTMFSSLVQLGAIAAPALPTLQDFEATHKDEKMRKSATDAIKLINEKLKKK